MLKGMMSIVFGIAVGGFLLAGCAESETSDEVPFGVADREVIEPTAFDAVQVGDCLGDSVPIDDEVPTVPCAEPGALPIQAVTTVGQDAPADRPATAVITGYATAACEVSAQAYADERGIPLTGLLQVAVVPEEQWAGPLTPVVCAVTDV